MLITIDSVLTPAQLQEIQALLQNAEWLSGSLTAGSTAQQVKNNHQLSPNSEASHTIRHIVLEALNHNATFFSAALPLRVFPPRINRHGVGEYYGAHYDNAILRHPQAGSVRSDVSCTVFLNNPEDYEGGELHIQDTFGEQRVKLRAGSAVLYPSSSLHPVLPVTKGQRLGCFFWMQSMVRSDAQRRLLYELDCALTALRQQHGESAETTQLTGTYHNLLRMWAET